MKTRNSMAAAALLIIASGTDIKAADQRSVTIDLGLGDSYTRYGDGTYSFTQDLGHGDSHTLYSDGAREYSQSLGDGDAITIYSDEPRRGRPPRNQPYRP